MNYDSRNEISFVPWYPAMNGRYSGGLIGARRDHIRWPDDLRSLV